MENILLAATEKNYGSCVIGELYDKYNDIAQYINVNMDGLRQICGILIGCSEKPIIDRAFWEALDFMIGTVE